MSSYSLERVKEKSSNKNMYIPLVYYYKNNCNKWLNETVYNCVWYIVFRGNYVKDIGSLNTDTAIYTNPR